MARIRKNGNGGKKKQSPRGSNAPPPPEREEAAEKKPAPDAQAREASDFSPTQFQPIFKTFAETTSNVVREAASILEEEIAAGIVAARQIENKFINSEELRSGKPDEVLGRFRRDAHEVIDIVLDIVSATVRNAGRMAQRAISIREGVRDTPPATTSMLTMTHPVKSGETGEVTLVIENDGETNVEPFALRSTDLISTAGDRISSSAVRFDPETISVASHQNQKVVVSVTPAAGTPPGTYSGLIQSSRSDQLRAVLNIIVA